MNCHTFAGCAPGVVAVSSRMSKRRCRTCPGREGCIHVNIYDQKTSAESNGMVASDEEMPSQNKDFHPRENQNQFQQQFTYPPTEKDQESCNRINTTENLFPCGRMIPTGYMVEKCECGHTFNQVLLESNHPIIHHSRPTYDSRDGPLSTYKLGTGKCEHYKHYSGTEDGLIRCSAPMRHQHRQQNFVSVDIMNEYLATLFGTGSSGKSLKSFVAAKNSLNCDQRGDKRKIDYYHIRNAFHVYLTAIIYDPEVGFGCPKCPTQLGKNENEEDYDDIECHISDGIDMGCQENIVKGMISEEMFRIERTGQVVVMGTECYERAILPTQSMRQSLMECVEMDFNKQSVRAAVEEIGKQADNPRCIAIKTLLKFVSKQNKIDDCYRELLKELAKDSPISIWLPGLESQSFATLRSFLECERNVFEHHHDSSELHNKALNRYTKID